MFTSRRNPAFIPELLNAFLGDNWSEPIRNAFKKPAINLLENDSRYKVEIAAPGMQKSEFSIKINKDGELVISTEKEAAAPADENTNAETVENEAANDDRYLRHDFAKLSFTQTFTLPEDVDLSAIAAHMEDGILSIEMPKKKPVEPEDNSRLIEVL